MNAAADLLRLIAALGMFLAGLRLFTEGMRQPMWDHSGRIMAQLTCGGWSSFRQGLELSFLYQSSVRSSILVTVLLQCGILDLKNGIIVLGGACLGSLPAAFLPVLAAVLPGDMILYISMLILVMGFLLTGLDNRHSAGCVLMGLGLSGLGICTAFSQISGYHMVPGLSRFFAVIGSSSLVSFLIGMAAGSVMQSGLAGCVLLQMGASTRFMSRQAAVFLMTGAMAGAVFPVIRSAMGRSSLAKRGAAARVIFTAAGIVPWLVLSGVLHWLAPAAAGTKADALMIAVVFAAASITGVAVVMPFARGLAHKLASCFSEEEERLQTSPYVQLADFPSFALHLADMKLEAMKECLIQLLSAATKSLLEQKEAPSLQEVKEKLAVNESECSQLLISLGTIPLILPEQKEMKYAILVLENFRQIAESSLQLAGLTANLVDADFKAQAGTDIKALSGECTAMLRSVFDRNPQTLAAKNRDKMRIMVSLMREGHLQRLMEGRSSPEKELLFMQAVNLYKQAASQARKAAQAGKEMELWKQS